MHKLHKVNVCRGGLVCPHLKSLKLLNGFVLHYITLHYTKICQESLSLFRFGPLSLLFYMTFKSFVFVQKLPHDVKYKGH